jgi:CheY-like chemotaxis protein
MPKILVVDDDKYQRLYHSKWLTNAGYEVVCAENGKEAVEKVETGGFDLITMDVEMPIMNGFEATKRIKGMKSLPFTPIIIVSSLDKPEDIEKGLNAGADEYCNKPANEVTLVARVRAVLRLKDAYDGLVEAKAEIEEEMNKKNKIFVDSLDIMRAPVCLLEKEAKSLLANRKGAPPEDVISIGKIMDAVKTIHQALNKIEEVHEQDHSMVEEL